MQMDWAQPTTTFRGPLRRTSTSVMKAIVPCLIRSMIIFQVFQSKNQTPLLLSQDDYLILPLNESIDNVSFCVNPGCVTYIWSKFKVCFVTSTGGTTTSGGSSSNIFINVISDGANIETPKAVCDTTP